MAAPMALADAEVHIDEDFEDSEFVVPDGVPWWWNASGDAEEDWAITDEEPADGKSLWISGGNWHTTYNKDFGSLAVTPSEEEPLVFQVDIYDFMDGDEGVLSYAEIRQVHDSQNTWRATIFAVGVFGDGSDHYRARIYPDHEWVTLTEERSEGWHTFTLVIRSDTVSVYVNQDPHDPEAESDPNATNLPWEPHAWLYEDDEDAILEFDALHLGGAASTDHEFLYDNVYLANDPALFIPVSFDEHPSPRVQVKEFGESVTYTVEISGPFEPFTYQWTHDHEPLEDDDRISGAQSDTLTIDNLDAPDSGHYRVVVADSEGNDRTSNPAELVALGEHEVLLNVMEIPEEDIDGGFGTFPGSETAGWFGWMAASQTNDEEEEQFANFRTAITETGWYDIYTYFIPSWAGPGNNRGSEVPYDVHHSDGMDTVFVNQQNPQGPAAADWVHVGTFHFEEGEEANVAISNLRRGPSGEDALGTLALADAVRYMPGEEPPTDVAEARLEALGRNDQGQFEIRLSGEPDTSYVIEAADDLEGWAPLGTETTDSEGVLEFTDEGSADLDRRFYRAQPE